MCGSSGAGDDDVESIVLRGSDVFGQGTRVAVGAEDALLIPDAELLESGAGGGHDVPVACASHYYGYLAHAKKVWYGLTIITNNKSQSYYYSGTLTKTFQEKSKNISTSRLLIFYGRIAWIIPRNSITFAGNLVR
jgi:hypothetical protein